jgi:hypothetical protein
MAIGMNVRVPRKVLHCGVSSATGTGFNVVMQNMRPVILENSVTAVMWKFFVFVGLLCSELVTFSAVT